jgi:alcohol dehydrogenase class IV
MKEFENYVPVKVVFGRGKLETIGSHTKKLGEKALIVTTGPFFYQSGLVDRIQKILAAEGVKSEYYHEISPNPHLNEAQAGADFARQNACDVVIGLGGGSAIDAAKCIAVAVAQGNDVWPFWMGEKEIFAALPIIAVTTTSGTGSHISSYSVITNSLTNEKPGAGSELLYAKVAIVDPELMISLPPKITAATGFDVLAHAIEAYTSKSATPFSELYCEKSIKLAGGYLRRAIADGNDVAAREMMALADTLSGYSIAIAVITMCHAIGHAVGGVCNTVHGESLAAMTPHTIRHSMARSPQKYKNIGAWLTGHETAPDDWTLEQTVEAVEKLISDIGMNIPLSQQGVSRADFDQIIAGTISYMGGGCDLDPAAPISADDVRKVLEAAF